MLPEGLADQPVCPFQACMSYTKLENGMPQHGPLLSTITVQDAFPLGSVEVHDISLLQSRIGALKVRSAVISYSSCTSSVLWASIMLPLLSAPAHPGYPDSIERPSMIQYLQRVSEVRVFNSEKFRLLLVLHN